MAIQPHPQHGLVNRFFLSLSSHIVDSFLLALNTTVANIVLFVYDPDQQIQSLYGYAQDARSIMRSDDRGMTWSVTDLLEYSNVRTTSFYSNTVPSKISCFQVTAQCSASAKVCRSSESYSLMSGAPGYFALQNGNIPWTAAVDGLWTQVSGGALSFDWFGY